MGWYTHQQIRPNNLALDLDFWIKPKTRDKLTDLQLKHFKELDKIKEEARSKTNGIEGFAATALGWSDSVNFRSSGTAVLQWHQVGCGLDSIMG